MRHRGFSLLEILVAFSILALSLGILMRIFSGGLTSADVARDRFRATLLAQTLLAGLGVESTLVAGENSGAQGDQFRWKVKVAAFDDPARAGERGPARATPAGELWRVSVHVSGGGQNGGSEQSITLDSLRTQARLPR